MNTKTIIVATDFSAEAENATNYAVAIAAEKGYRLVLFTLYNLSIHALNARSSAMSLDHMLTVKKEQIADITQSISEAFQIEVSAHLAIGNFDEELDKCIQKHRAWVVVMGMAEKSLEQELLGNTTTSVINRLKFPVIAVPLAAKYEGFKQILFAAEALRGIHAHVLNEVKEIALDFDAKVEVFHVREWMEKKYSDVVLHRNQTMIKQLFSGIKYAYRDVDSDEVIEAIKMELLFSNADLLIMVPHKHGFWNSLVHRSKTRLMASGLKVPMLSLPL